MIVIRDVTSNEVSMTQSPKGMALVKQKLVSELNCNILFNEVNSESDNEASEFQYYCLFSLLLTALHIDVLCLIKKVEHMLKTDRQMVSKFGQGANQGISVIQNSKITDFLTNTRRGRAST